MKPDDNGVDMDGKQSDDVPDISLVVTLPELLEFFTSPQHGRIVSGLDILSQAEYGLGLRPDTIFTFTRPLLSTSPTVTLTWQSSNSKLTIKVSIDCASEFILLPYDSVNDVCPTEPLRYKSIAAVAECFPPYILVESIQQRNRGHVHNVQPGDTLKLLRLVYSKDLLEAEKCIQCRHLNSTSLVDVPFSCIGEFTAIFDLRNHHVTYTIADLVAGHMFPSRRRRVQPVSADDDVIKGLPLDVAGNLYVEPLKQLDGEMIEARTSSNSTTVIRLSDSDRSILVSPTINCMNVMSLDSLVQQRAGVRLVNSLFPCIVRVVDWNEETAVLENHFVRPGVELVLHGLATLNKVLAKVNGVHYLVPLSYSGLFRRRARVFAGVQQLLTAVSQCLVGSLTVRVVYINLQEQLQVQLGDRIQVSASQNASPNNKHYVTCELLYGTGSREKRKEVKIPLNSNASFEEILPSSSSSSNGADEMNTHTIDELSQLMTSSGLELRVELIERSKDTVARSYHDLPSHTDIMLKKVIRESSVYASIESADSPVFHIPTRTGIQVCVVEKLHRTESPLIMAQSATRARSQSVVSILDRCAELLSDDAVTSLLQAQHEPSPSANGDQRVQQPADTNAVVYESLADATGALNFIDDDVTDDDDGQPAVTTAFSNSSLKPGELKLRLPDDGNLYHLSANKFLALLDCLKLDPQVVDVCRKRRMNGKQFSRITPQEMELCGLNNPVLVYFKQRTQKPTGTSSVSPFAPVSTPAAAIFSQRL